MRLKRLKNLIRILLNLRSKKKKQTKSLAKFMPRTKKRVGVIELDEEEDIKETLLEAFEQVFGGGGTISQLHDQRKEYEESKKKKLN